MVKITRILNFGSLNIDKTYSLDEIVAPGETVSSISYEEFVGGKGLNQTVALKRAGADVIHAGFVGSNDSKILLDFIKENQINSWVKAVDGSSGHAIIQIDSQGNNSIIVEGGANRKITTAYIDEVFEEFEAGDYLLLQNEINNNAYIIEKAKDKDMKIFLNPSPIDGRIREINLADIDTLVINEIEGYKLSGYDDRDEILSYFSKNYPKLELILTLGSDGGIYQLADDELKFDSYEVKVVDTTAAGDTFLGYFMAGKASGKAIKESLDLASKAAGLACTLKGAANSIPQLNNVLESEF